MAFYVFEGRKPKIRKGVYVAMAGKYNTPGLFERIDANEILE